MNGKKVGTHVSFFTAENVLILSKKAILHERCIFYFLSEKGQYELFDQPWLKMKRSNIFLGDVAAPQGNLFNDTLGHIKKSPSNKFSTFTF